MKLWFLYGSVRDTCYALTRRDLGKQIIVLNRIVRCLIGEPEFQKYKNHPATLAFLGDDMRKIMERNQELILSKCVRNKITMRG